MEKTGYCFKCHSTRKMVSDEGWCSCGEKLTTLNENKTFILSAIDDSVDCIDDLADADLPEEIQRMTEQIRALTQLALFAV